MSEYHLLSNPLGSFWEDRPGNWSHIVARDDRSIKYVHNLRSGIARLEYLVDGQQGSVDKLIFAGHGNRGQFWLGESLISYNNAEDYKDAWERLGKLLSDDAEIVFQGCLSGAGEKGEQFVRTISQLTGSTVVAGNWFQFSTPFLIGPTTQASPIPILSIGDSGDEVLEIQNIINSLPNRVRVSGQIPLLTQDGQYGQLTKLSVLKLQEYINKHILSSSNHINEDGIWGANTYYALQDSGILTN